MTSKTRLDNIEKSLEKKTGYRDIPILTLLNIERWNYEIDEAKPIKYEDWQIYMERELRHAADKDVREAELKVLEEKIRSRGRFIPDMRIEFVDMGGNHFEEK